jgi:hypothetical protein
MSSFLLRFAVSITLVAALLFSSTLPAAAQDTPQTLTGWLNVLHGDPERGSDSTPRYAVLLQSDSGSITAELLLNPETARQFTGQKVQVQAIPSISASSIGLTNTPIYSVQAVEPLEAQIEAQGTSGAQAWILILCRFPDVSTDLNNPGSYAPLLSSEYPGLDHYWRTISYNNINLQGSTITNRWYTLPRPRSAYLPGGNANLMLLAQDCATAANADIYYPSYIGLSFMFNAGLDCCAWGGGTTLTLDGSTRSYRAIWLPPWAQNYNIMAHEMGHGFGFPHSTGPFDNPPSDLSIYVSQWDVMSASGGTCAIYTSNMCIPPATIAYHLDLNNWIPANRKTSVVPGEDRSITLERTQSPTTGNSLLYARVPIGGSNTHFYTVEVRDQIGYDLNIPPYYTGIPLKSVVIHEVDTVNHIGNGGPAYVVDDDPVDFYDRPNGEGARWLVGETFNDLTNDISISVSGAGATTFTVSIHNGSTPTQIPNAPSNFRITHITPDSLTLEWDDNAFNETAYRLYKWQGSSFVLYQTLPANTTLYTDSNLFCGYYQFYKVTAFNSAAPLGQQESPIQDDASWVTGVTGPCATDSGAPIQNIVNQPYTLTWTTVSWAALYHVQIAYDSAFTQTLVEVTIPAPYLQYIVDGISPGSYYWRVQGVNSSGVTGGWSVTETLFIMS